MPVIIVFKRLRQEDYSEFEAGLGWIHSKTFYLKRKKKNRAGEVAQQLRALADLPEDLGSIPNTHMATHNCL